MAAVIYITQEEKETAMRTYSIKGYWGGYWGGDSDYVFYTDVDAGSEVSDE